MTARAVLARHPFVAAAAAAFAVGTSIALSAPKQCADEHDLVSDQAAVADHQDTVLLNAWGVAFVPGGYAWVANNHSATSTAYDGTGAKLATVITIPGPAAGGAGAPTGVVYNSTCDFLENGEGNPAPATLIFAGEDGVISSWNGAIDGNTAQRRADRSAASAIYKGVAIANNGAANFVYATDFHNGAVDVFDKNFGLVTVPGGFADTTIPKGFAPFGIQNVGGVLYVTYAQQDADAEDDVPGKSKGYVNCFDANGFRLRRFAQRAHLNAPWGIAQAPSDFGDLGDRLLVGNFGDGTITAYDIASGHFEGQLRGTDGKTASIEGLWGIAFGNDAHDQPHQTLFFAAGPGDEANGLYGRLDAGDCPQGNH